MITLKERLKKDLKKKRYNLGHLAEMAGISQSYLSNILSGYRTPPEKLAIMLAFTASNLTGKEYTYNQFTE